MARHVVRLPRISLTTKDVPMGKDFWGRCEALMVRKISGVFEGKVWRGRGGCIDSTLEYFQAGRPDGRVRDP